MCTLPLSARAVTIRVSRQRCDQRGTAWRWTSIPGTNRRAGRGSRRCRAPTRMATPCVRRELLPAQLTSFVGREHHLAEVRRLLAECRLVTLTGFGGVGKTRLGLEVADSLLDAYPHGV